MTVIRRIVQLFAAAVVLIGLSSTTLPAVHANTTPSHAPAQEKIYAVDNATDNGTSQFYTIQPGSLAVTPLGPVTKHDFEDVAIRPSTHDLFASTGIDVKQDKGMIYHVDGLTGAVTPVGKSGFDRITIMKFRPSDDSLWGWAEGKGLVQLDQNTGKGTLIYASSKKFEGMAWQPDGTLYLAIDTQLYILDLAAGTLKLYASNLPKGTESLATLYEGALLGGVTVKGKTNLVVYNIPGKYADPLLPLNSSFKSIEGLCVPSGLYG